MRLPALAGRTVNRRAAKRYEVLLSAHRGVAGEVHPAAAQFSLWLQYDMGFDAPAPFSESWLLVPDTDFERHARAVLNDRTVRQHWYLLAAKKLHPDNGGTAAEFQRLQDAKELLDSLAHVAPQS